MTPVQLAALYAAGVSLLAAALTVSDKRRARRRARRIPERTLLTVAALGGAAAMLITMRCIRHKTRHPRFMIGLPAMIIAHAALIVWAIYTFLPAALGF